MRIPANLRVKLLKEAIANGLQLLTYDIETSHMLVRTFYIGSKVFLRHDQIKEPSKVISIQYQFQDMKKAKYLKWDKNYSAKSLNRSVADFDDTLMLEEFATNILPKADIILGQNSDRFDFITLNERMKVHHLSLLDPRPSIDILKLSRKSFRAASHKLDYRSHQQGLGGKIIMIDQDWVDIEENGVPVSKKMAPYGCKDVEDTTALFWAELPYYKDLPIAVEKVILSFLDKKIEKKVNTNPKCKKCKSSHVWKKGKDINKHGPYNRYKCADCNHFFNDSKGNYEY
jgi:hypothetical protein